MDRLSPLFANFTPSAQVFHAGNSCQLAHFSEESGRGHVHLLRGGAVLLRDRGARPVELAQPSLIVLPRPATHSLEPVQPGGADLVCATIDWGDETRAALVAAMPDCLVLPLAQSPQLALAAQLLFDEAFAQHCGRQAALDRLTEYMVVLLLRHLMEAGRVSGGVLAALADARLSKAVTAMHTQPGKPWTLETLAHEAGMSRARFASHFRETTGRTALDYLGHWRITVAKTMLRKGKALKMVAPLVGYTNATALTRAFVQRIGHAPTQWLAQTRQGDAA